MFLSTRIQLAILIALCAGVSAAQNGKLSSGKLEKIDAAVSKFMASTHVPGMSVAVVENGEYEWAQGFGFADLENNAPASEHTLFRLGSISKSFTSTAGMQLWDRGRLDLDAPVQEYCPSFPQKPWPISTRQVLGHLGGIRHYKANSQDDPEVGNTKHFDDPVQGRVEFFQR
jgi:serine beta-lactamase-like protein LACTB, mitochondrial